MNRVLIGLIAGFAALVTFTPHEASARFAVQGLEAPDLVEGAQCVTRRERVVRPNGRVIYRTVERCRPGFGPRVDRCRVVRERVTRPNGRVVLRTVRRCG